MSDYHETRPFAGQLAFGSSTRPSSSLHTPQTTLLPPLAVWRPPVDSHPAAVLTSSQLPAVRDGSVTGTYDGGCARSDTSPPGQRERCGSPFKLAGRPTRAAVAASPRVQEAEARLCRALEEVEVWRERRPEPWSRTAAPPPGKQSWITAGPRSIVGPRAASTKPRPRSNPRAQRAVPASGARLPDATGAASALAATAPASALQSLSPSAPRDAGPFQPRQELQRAPEVVQGELRGSQSGSEFQGRGRCSSRDVRRQHCPSCLAASCPTAVRAEECTVEGFVQHSVRGRQ